MSEIVIDLSAVVQNAEKIKKQSPLIAVVKDDAYGHGSVEVARCLKGVADCFAVATASEAEALIAAGITEDILVLCPAHYCLPAKNVIYTVSSAEDIDRLCRFMRPRVAVKVNTGMNRFGVSPDKAGELLDYARERAFLHSAYSHLRAPEDDESPELQLLRFHEATDGKSVMRHLAASRGIALGRRYAFDAVRCGNALYGGMEGYSQAMSVQAPVLAVRDVPAGEGVGYGSETFERPTRVAVIGIGYADGYRRLTAPRYVAINCVKCRVTGVCMDVSFAVLPEGADASDTAEILGNHITVGELARSYGTITYEVFTSFGKIGNRRYG